MNLDERERKFIANAKSVLDKSVKNLDAQVRSRLRHARNRALEARPSHTAWVLAGGLAAASVAALAVTLWLVEPGVVEPIPDVQDLELLTAADNLEFYGDLEFYRWLADQDRAG